MPLAPYIRVYTAELNMGIHQTKTFMNGNSVAVRLPKELNVRPGTSVQIERQGDQIVIRPEMAEDPAEVRRKMKRLIADLDAIGRPGVVEERDPDIFPDRPGLY